MKFDYGRMNNTSFASYINILLNYKLFN